MSIPCVPATGVRSRSWFVRPLSVIVVLGMIATAGEARGRVQDQASRPAAGAEVPLERHVTITGRVVDAQTGKGIAGVGLRSSLITPQNSLQFVGAGPDRRRRPIHDRGAAGEGPGPAWSAVPKTYLGLRLQRMPQAGGHGRPDLARPEARPRDRARRRRRRRGRPAGRRGRGLRAAARPAGLRLGRPRARTGPDGTFHLEQLDPDDTLPVWARTKEATTDGTVVIRPGEVKGKLTLTIDPKFAFRIRGLVTDRSGKRIAGARVDRLVVPRATSAGSPIGRAWGSAAPSTRRRPTSRAGSSSATSGRAIGTRSSSRPRATARPSRPRSGKAGETHDFGTIVLTGVDGHLAGRVVGSDGSPIAGATVFNRGDAPRPVEALTDARADSGSTGCSRGPSTRSSARTVIASPA